MPFHNKNGNDKTDGDSIKDNAKIVDPSGNEENIDLKIQDKWGQTALM